MDWNQFLVAVKRQLFPPLKALPNPVYTDLVVKWKQPHETLERLRCVKRKGDLGGRQVTLVRIVDPGAVKRLGLQVREYADLDGHTAVIWYEGWVGYMPVLEVHLTRGNAAPEAP